MNEFVQAFVKETGAWRVFHVKTGQYADVPDKQPNIDEIDPIEPEAPERVEVSDPLGSFR